MVRRRHRGGDLDASSPEVARQLQLIADFANGTTMTGGVEEQAPGQPAAQAQAPAQPGTILRNTVGEIIVDISRQTQAKIVAGEQVLADAIGVIYKNTGTALSALTTANTATSLTGLATVMGVAKFIAKNIPRTSWNQLGSSIWNGIAPTGEALYETGSFAVSPTGIVLIAATLINAGARQANKPVMTYVQDLSKSTSEAVLAQIKKELLLAVRYVPASELNDEIKLRLAERQAVEGLMAITRVRRGSLAAAPRTGGMNRNIRKSRKTRRRGGDPDKMDVDDPRDPDEMDVDPDPVRRPPAPYRSVKSTATPRRRGHSARESKLIHRKTTMRNMAMAKRRYMNPHDMDVDGGRKVRRTRRVRKH